MFYKITKRIIDIIGSIVGLIILIPFAIVIALAIKIDSFFSVIPGSRPYRSDTFGRVTRNLGFFMKNWIPAFLRQDSGQVTGMTNSPVFVKLDRVSKGNVINLYKFRSMVIDAEEKKGDLLPLNERQDGPFFKIKNDPRITKVGKFLRKFRLDEFPQLINVLKGDISLVGPRPHEPEEMFFYPQEHRGLFLAKTGMTGISQTNGASGLPFLKELEFDTYYLKNQSLWLDIKILFKTLFIFFTDPTGV